ncbi:trna-specific 2-thiouridylase mnma [Quercus suber]|uniref:Trna-specific 2-thiouridylase mnma n=1 Tax=Quercus suber TaxID=58331 RepID=A0AAW0JJR8_QUESU
MDRKVKQMTLKSQSSSIKFSEFVTRHIGEMEGVILEAETGDFLGKHQGPGFYNCSLEMELGQDGCEDVVHLSEDDQGLTAG